MYVVLSIKGLLKVVNGDEKKLGRHENKAAMILTKSSAEK